METELPFPIESGARVRSKTHACYEGTVVGSDLKTYAIRWDGKMPTFSYLHEDEFIVIKPKGENNER